MAPESRIRSITHRADGLPAGLFPWLCRCGRRGAASTEENAALEWLSHHNVEHGGTIAAADLRDAIATAA